MGAAAVRVADEAWVVERTRRAFDLDLVGLLPFLQTFAISLCRNPDRAADLVQDTVERALLYRDRYQAGTNLRAWLCTIMRNTLYSDKRRDWRWTQPPINAVGEDIWFIPVGPGQLAKLELDDLLEALACVPARQRDAVLMAMEGLTLAEIAAETAVAEGTVKSRLSRGRSALEAWFGMNVDRSGRA